MFGLDAVSFVDHRALRWRHLLAEVVATFGLLVVIFGTLRSGRPDTVAFAVGGYISAAYWFTSSTSFANPAVTVARMLSDTFAGIAPSSVMLFVAMQVLGGRWPLVRAPALPRPQKGTIVTLPTVLFVCVHNAGRSQMAAGFLQHLAGDRVEVLSAGSHRPTPSTRWRWRPWPRLASTSRPQPEAADGRGGPGVRRGGDHGLRGRLSVLPRQAVRGLAARRPGRQGIEAVRPIRDEIRERIEGLLAELLAG